jgi:hypothetical protein
MGEFSSSAHSEKERGGRGAEGEKVIVVSEPKRVMEALTW